MKSGGPRSRRENQANERNKALLTGNVVSRIVHHRGRQGGIQGWEWNLLQFAKTHHKGVILAYYPRKAVTFYAMLEIGTDYSSYTGLTGFLI